MSQDDRDGFACVRCGNCCRVPGYVKLTDADVLGIAEYLGLDVSVFTQEHTRLLPDRSGLALLEEADGTCAFLDHAVGCQIQSVKPEQCRGFPFSWRYADMTKICEGWKK